MCLEPSTVAAPATTPSGICIGPLPIDTSAAFTSSLNMGDTSPPTKRVRISEGDNGDDALDDVDGTNIADASASDIPSSQESAALAFLTPPTSATIPSAQQQSASSDAVLTHDNLCGAATGSPKAAVKDVFYTPRGGGSGDGSGSGSGIRKNCDSGRSPAGPMTHKEIKTLLLSEANYDVDDPANVKKREGYLTWDDYFMAVASLSSQRSKDPHSQVGACIVDEDNRIVGIG